MVSSLHFAEFRLDLERMSLIGPAGRVDLRPKSFEVLRYLAEHAERIVAKDELLKAIWPDVIVTEDSLTQCISEIRRAIGGEAQALIKTVPKRGYMLDVPVGPPAQPATPPPPAENDKPEAASEPPSSPLDFGSRTQATAIYVEFGRTLTQAAETDSETAVGLYETLLAQVTKAVERYGGTVTSASEDGVAGVFGVPVMLEDHAVRACFAASDIQSTMEPSLPIAPNDLGIGIASGELVTKPSASLRDGGLLRVLGPPVLRATRFARAAHGSILMGPVASRLARGHVQVTDAGPTIAEACGEPVVELVRVVSAQTRFQVRAAHGLTPFVGRTREMEHLEKAADDAHRGRGRVVAVIGDPGIGKSRLVHEFLRSEQTGSWLALTTGAVAHRAPASFQSIADLLKSYFHIVAGDDAGLRRARVVAKLKGNDDNMADLSAYLSLIDEHVEDPGWLALEPTWRRERIFSALKRLLLGEALNQPVLLVFEDLHWIDADTQAFLDTLVDGIALTRVLVVVTYRPNYEHKWGGKSFYTQLRLEDLAPEHSGKLLSHLVGNDPSLTDLRQFLQKQGNPLFLEESVRSFADDATLAGQRGSYRLTRRLDDLRVPAAIHAIIAARIDRLEAREKHLLQAAAAIGKDFGIGILRRIASLPDRDCDLAFAGLQNAELVLQADFSADPRFTFKHALIHEVAYGSLLAEQRRHFHTEIVAAIEDLPPDRRIGYVEQLAHHASCGNLTEKAARYYREAGMKAFARSSNREAVGHYEQALGWLAQLPETRETQEQAIDLRLDLRSALYPLAEYGKIRGYLLEAEKLAQKLGDQSRLGWISAYMASLYLTTGGDASTARALGERSEAIAGTLGETRLQVAAQYYIAWASYIAADFARTESVCRAIMGALKGERRQERFGVVVPAVQSRVYLARALAERGCFKEANAQGQDAIDLAEQFDHPFSRCWACLGLAYVKNVQGEWLEAGHLLERASAECWRWKIGVQAPLVMALLGHVTAQSGRVQEGIGLLEQAVSEYRGAGTEHFLSIGIVQLGQAYLLAGQTDKAHESADRAILLAGRRGERGFEAWALHLHGEIAARRHGAGANVAIAHFRKAMAQASELGMKPLIAHCNLALGTQLNAAGQASVAKEHQSVADTLYRKMGMAGS